GGLEVLHDLLRVVLGELGPGGDLAVDDVADALPLLVGVGDAALVEGGEQALAPVAAVLLVAGLDGRGLGLGGRVGLGLGEGRPSASLPAAGRGSVWAGGAGAVPVAGVACCVREATETDCCGAGAGRVSATRSTVNSSMF